MSIHVERPSRTVGERLGAVGRGVVYNYFKFFGVVCAAVLGAGIVADLTSFLGEYISGVLALAGMVGVFYLCYRSQGRAVVAFVRRRFSNFRPEVSPEELAAAESDAIPELSHDDTFLGGVVEDGIETEMVAYLEPNMRNRHVYVIGKTRSGKTTLLKNMILQDMERGAGVGFIDPHGDAAEELLGLVPEHRVSDVIYFDPTKPGSPAFNPFALPYAPPKLAEDIVSVFRMLFGDSWGPRMEHLLRFGVLTLLSDSEPHSLSDLRTLYVDDDVREGIVSRLDNSQLVEFWETEYPQMPKGAASPILNKLSAFLAPMSDLERVFSRRENDLDFTGILDGEKILIINLAKGVLGDEPARLLGGLIVAGIQQAALARASLRPEDRRDFYFFVDEFHNFTVSSFESILSESAKYRLNLTLANQNLGQLSSTLERGVFGNCGTVVSFQVSSDDAPKLRKEMHRSRTVVRQKEGNDFYALSDLVAHQTELYREALGDEYLGMSLDERRNYRDSTKYGDASSMLAAARQGAQAGEMMQERRAEMQRVLEILEQDQIEVKTLREIFPEWEFRELSFPDVDDFLNVPPHYAFCRIGSADNVAAIHCVPSPDPDPERRAVVFEHLEKFAPRAEAQPAETAPTRSREPEQFRE